MASSLPKARQRYIPKKAKNVTKAQAGKLVAKKLQSKKSKY